MSKTTGLTGIETDEERAESLASISLHSLASTSGPINLNKTVQYDPVNVVNGTTIFQYDCEEEEDNKIKKLGKIFCSKIAIIIFANIIGVSALAVLGITLGLSFPYIAGKTYNETCFQNSDCRKISDYGFICNNGKCTCMDTSYFYKETCMNKKSYLEYCVEPFECDTNKNLSCQATNGTTLCLCAVDRYWNGTDCTFYGSNNVPCTSSSECKTELGLECTTVNGTSMCACNSTLYWNGTVCDLKKSFNSTCTLNSSCDALENLFCAAYDSAVGVCGCQPTYYRHSASAKCLKQFNFNSSCTSGSSECRTDLGLYCGAQLKCSCVPPSEWSTSVGSCLTSVGYGQTCNSVTSICDTSLLLSCQSGRCYCTGNYFWSAADAKCITRKTIGGACTSNSQCSSALSLTCSGSCICPYYMYWNGTMCVGKLTYLKNCSNTIQCQDYNGLSCQNSTCLCPNGVGWFWSYAVNYCVQCPSGTNCTCSSTQIYSPGKGSCVINVTYNEICDWTIPCDTLLNLECHNSRCQCPTSYTWNGTNCVTQKTYGESCATTADCLTSLNLVCASTCACSSVNYWNGTACVAKLTNGDSCKNTTECQDYNGLSCQNAKCSCPTSSDWFWSTASLKCVTCPSGWTIYFGHCYYVNTSPKTWTDALNWCKGYGATLMQIRNEAEYQLLYNFYVTYSPTGQLWIGARSTSLFDFRWPDDTSLSKTSSWWCTGEPNNTGGNNAKGIIGEDSVFMWTKDNKICLNDYTGTSAEAFCCEKSV